MHDYCVTVNVTYPVSSQTVLENSGSLYFFSIPFIPSQI